MNYAGYTVHMSTPLKQVFIECHRFLLDTVLMRWFQQQDKENHWLCINKIPASNRHWGFLTILTPPPITAPKWFSFEQPSYIIFQTIS
jgi:hypothetical protein